MKITICAYDSPGNIDGPSAWIKRLLPWMENRGVQARVIFFSARDKNLPVFNYLQSKGISCKLIYWDLFQEKKIQLILEDLNQHRPDVFIPNYFPIAIMASKWVKAAGIPTIAVLHNDNDFHYNLIKTFAHVNGNYISAVVSVSQNIAENIAHLVYKECKSCEIACGAPVSNKKVPLPPQGKLKVIYAGRLEEKQKKISELTRAFCRAAEEVEGTEYFIYGSGPALNSVLKLIAIHGKGLPVSYGGVLDSNHILDSFSQHHVFVLFSDFEGIPISLMEAMGCGLVPICTYIKSGVTQIVKNNETGILVNDRDISFINAIKLLRDDEQLYCSLSMNARKIIENDYSEEACNTKWLKLLEKVTETSMPPTNIEVPSLQELKKHKMPPELQVHGLPTPHTLLIPLFKGKYFLSMLKRKLKL